MTQLERIVFEQDGQAKTDSRIVAKAFGKRHDNVIRAIRNIIENDEDADLTFEVSEYVDTSGRTLPFYVMGETEFTLLVLGFNGPKAAAWKRKYVLAFQAMRTRLTELASIETNQLIKDKDQRIEKLERLLETVSRDPDEDSAYIQLPDPKSLLSFFWGGRCWPLASV